MLFRSKTDAELGPILLRSFDRPCGTRLELRLPVLAALFRAPVSAVGPLCRQQPSDEIVIVITNSATAALGPDKPGTIDPEVSVEWDHELET